MADETAEEKKEREDKAKHDAAVMDTLKRMDARMDAMEASDKARRDAEEAKAAEEKEAREDAARKDAARKDRFGRRADGEAYKDWKTRHDADEAAMCDAFEKGGVEKDKARKDAKDCRMDAEESERKDGGEGFEKWAKEEAAEPEHKEDKAKKDAEEKERMEADKARHDAQTKENATLKDQLAALAATVKTLTTEVPAGERDALAKAQFRADSVAVMFGDRAPVPMAGETSGDYRKRILKKFQPHSVMFKTTPFEGIPVEALGGIEDTVYADAVAAAKAPASARPGLLMPIEERDRAGRTITKYVGDNMAWMSPYMSQGATGRIRRNPNSNEGA
jgi:hypothetical protein